jgi:hypothetical protein
MRIRVALPTHATNTFPAPRGRNRNTERIAEKPLSLHREAASWAKMLDLFQRIPEF